MFYYDNHFAGMHLIWWFIWALLFFWVFATPFYVPNQLKRKDTPLDALQRRFANGQISKEEYLESKSILS